MPCSPTTRNLSIVYDATTDTIDIQENGVAANHLQVCPGDTLNYSCDLAWAIQFISEGPPEDPGHSSPPRTNPPLNEYALTGPANQQYGLTVDAGAAAGNHWDYVVVVVDSGGVVRTQDPEIVIQSRG